MLRAYVIRKGRTINPGIQLNPLGRIIFEPHTRITQIQGFDGQINRFKSRFVITQPCGRSNVRNTIPIRIGSSQRRAIGQVEAHTVIGTQPGTLTDHDQNSARSKQGTDLIG